MGYMIFRIRGKMGELELKYSIEHLRCPFDGLAHDLAEGLLSASC